MRLPCLDKDSRTINVGEDKLTITEAYRVLMALFSSIYDFHKKFPEDEVEPDIRDSCLYAGQPSYIDEAIRRVEEENGMVS